MKICVVIVTFNRLKCLEKSLKKFSMQSYLPVRIIVVNNKSTDGTKEFLEKWKIVDEKFEKVVVNTDRNLGGAGGFSTGLKEASQYADTDWIWLSDDDAFVEEDTLERLYTVYRNKLSDKEIAAVFTSVKNNGEYDLTHRRRVEKRITGVKFLPVSADEYKKGYFEIDQGSYVGMLVKSDAIKKVGGTRDDFFIYYDDTEHCERLRKYGKLICIPSSETIHDIPISTGVNWKSYYGLRNSIILMKKHYGLFYAINHCVKRYIKSVSILNRHNSKQVKLLFKTALIDGLKENTGLHEVYKPGWKIKE